MSPVLLASSVPCILLWLLKPGTSRPWQNSSNLWPSPKQTQHKDVSHFLQLQHSHHDIAEKNRKHMYISYIGNNYAISYNKFLDMSFASLTWHKACWHRMIASMPTEAKPQNCYGCAHCGTKELSIALLCWRPVSRWVDKEIAVKF